MNFSAFDKYCRSLPAATYDRKWEVDHTYCVGGKMFAVAFQPQNGPLRVSFKVDPERFLELTDRPGFLPAPYLARAKWVQITDTSCLASVELKSLIARSHALIAAKLTKALRKELGLD